MSKESPIARGIHRCPRGRRFCIRDLPQQGFQVSNSPLEFALDEQLRNELQTGDLSFEQAARRYFEITESSNPYNNRM